MKITKDQIEQGRLDYEDFLAGRSGGFYSSVFMAISRADPSNMYRCAKGFPGETWAYLEAHERLNAIHWRVVGETPKEEMLRQFPGIHL